ncbi:MAG TPA: tetratricopeptide repeat protein [Thermoplasmata archaeon]|nr:tetratricopeptide repeat protein [Thermoplasmata archaeon]
MPEGESTEPVAAASPMEEIRRRYRAAQEAEGRPDRSAYIGALKVFLAAAEQNRSGLTADVADVVPMLHEAAMAFYRASQPELARRAADLGLELAPGSASLLHDKALILLAQNQELPEVLNLVDRAIEANPHDKGLWATRADTLRLLGRAEEAVDSYLRAQDLDASSMQFVDKALKLAPSHPAALRKKLSIARALGGELQALAACDELLKANPDDLELQFARAELLVGVGNLAEALVPLEKVRAARPDDARTALLRAHILFQLGRTEEAIPIAKAIVEGTTAPEANALMELARLSEASSPDLALVARERIVQIDPRNLQNLLDLRDLALRLDRVDTALSACRAILEVQPDNLEALRGVAELELANGHAAAALDGYRRLLKVHPHALSELRKALELARDQHNPDAVREFAQAVITEEPADLEAQVELARTLATTGDVPGAIHAYDALLESHPGELPYLLEKKEVVARTDDPAQIAPVLDELFRLDPTRTDVGVERGNLYLSLAYDRPEGSAERDQAARTALVSYERASSDPEVADISDLGIARASRLVNDSERAIRAYESFLNREGNHMRHDILKELGHALRETGRYSEAIEAYGRAIAGGLEDADLFWGAAEVFAEVGQEARALQLLDVLLRRDANNPLFLRKKGQLLLRTGHRTEALAILQQAVQAAHGDPHSYFEVAEALRAQGAYADAISYYRRGLEVDPRSRHGRLALSETLFLAGQYPEAVQIVDPLLKEDPNDLAAWKARADAFRALGRTNEVLYSLKAILLLEPENGPALLEMFQLHRDAKETKEAYETLARLLATSSPEAQDATLHLERGDLAAALGKTEEANEAYERAASLDPVMKLEIATRRARLRLTAGRPDLALEVLDEGMKSVPPGSSASLAALLLRAEVLGALERPAEARGAYEEVRQRDPTSPVALAGIGKSMLDEGKHAEAVEFLRGAIPQVPPQESLYLLLAEAYAGVAQMDAASEAIKKAVEALPKSVALWVRAGELAVARQAWPEAASAFAHALALQPAAVEVLLRAGFVAERLEHPNEALAFYERGTEADPSNKQAWTSRGLALLATGRPSEAQTSFDRALALDSDYAPAKDGKKLAIQKTRDAEVQRYARDALLLEARLNRTVTKNDLFVTLHVPYEFLEPVLGAIGRNVKVNLDRLEPNEIRDLENASYHLVTSAVEHRPPGIERRGLTLADVAVLSPPAYSLDQIERLFGYLRAVLEADLRPENLKLTPDVEELARKALVLPPEQRTLFQLVRTLRVGIYKARLIKVVEQAGSAVHAPLASLDLGAYSPEFRPRAEAEPEGPATMAPGGPVGLGEGPETVVVPAPAAEWVAPTDEEIEATPETGSPAVSAPSAAPARCVGCGGIASVAHSCGAPLCQHCVGQFPSCPKCGQAVTTDTARPLHGVTVQAPTGRAVAHGGGITSGLKSVFQRKSATPKTESARHETHPPKAAPSTRPEPPTKTAKPAPEHARASPAPAAKPPSKPAAPTAAGVPKPPAPPETEPPAPPAPRPRREKTDDEPRL